MRRRRTCPAGRLLRGAKAMAKGDSPWQLSQFTALYSDLLVPAATLNVKQGPGRHPSVYPQSAGQAPEVTVPSEQPENSGSALTLWLMQVVACPTFCAKTSTSVYAQSWVVGSQPAGQVTIPQNGPPPHIPALQTGPVQFEELHTTSQPPQCLTSLYGFTQPVPGQKICGDGQRQAPFRQLVPGGQTLPHEPQFFGSEARMAHAPEQHDSPELQGFPQPPQLCGSVWVLLQVPEQLVGALGGQTQRPPAQSI